jgi:hypothetical protein
MQYFYTFLFSLFLHLLLVSLLDKVPDHNKPDDLPVEIVYPKLSKSEQKNLVRETEQIEQKEIDEKKKARFLSEKQKRFAEESRVRNSGLTQNPGGGGTEQKKEKKPGPGKVAKEFVPVPNPFGTVGPGRGTAQGAVGEKLPDDVKFGSFNALNTDRYLYYTFFSRVDGKAA